jgi:hypothetical protein
MLFCLGMEVIAIPLTFIAGFAHDIVLTPHLTPQGTLEKQPAASSPR